MSSVLWAKCMCRVSVFLCVFSKTPAFMFSAVFFLFRFAVQIDRSRAGRAWHGAMTAKPNFVQHLKPLFLFPFNLVFSSTRYRGRSAAPASYGSLRSVPAQDFGTAKIVSSVNGRSAQPSEKEKAKIACQPQTLPHNPQHQCRRGSPRRVFVSPCAVLTIMAVWNLAECQKVHHV